MHFTVFGDFFPENPKRDMVLSLVISAKHDFAILFPESVGGGGVVVVVYVGEEKEGDDVVLTWRHVLTWLVTRRDDVTLCLSHHHLINAT